MKKDTILHAIAKQLVRNWRTPVRSAAYSSALTSALRVFVVSFLLMVGAGEIWGQVTDGVYYITNSDDQGNLPTPNPYGYDRWYLWPSVTTNGVTGQQYVTTYYDAKAPECNENGVSYEAYDNTYSHWVVKNLNDGTGRFQLINPKLNKYIVIRSKLSYGDRDVWLDDEPTGADIVRSYFKLNGNTSPYLISPTINATTNITNATEYTAGKYTLNSAKGNKRYLCSTNDKQTPVNTDSRPGMLQFYENAPKWTFAENKLAAPTITFYSETSKATVTDNNSLPSGYNIRYTFGDGNQANPTETSPVMDADGYIVRTPGTLKVVVERYGVVLTEVQTLAVTPTLPTCGTPSITYSNATGKVTIESSTEDATVLYSTDGSVPSLSYDSPFSITEETTIKAIAQKSGYTDSEIAEETIIKVATPTIVNDGTYIVISSATDGATIYYTTEASGTPSTQYDPDNKPVASDHLGETFRAIAKKDNCITSDESESLYVRPSCPLPVISLDYTNGEVTIQPSTDYTIYYTTDGTDPTTSSTEYTGAFVINQATTIKAISTNSTDNPSSVATENYSQVATPSIQNNGSNAISITCGTEDASIYYTSDGTAPTMSADQYSAEFGFAFSNKPIKARAFKEGMVPSAVADNTIKLQLPKPTITIGDNGVVTLSIDPVITGVTYKYTTDGSDPSTNGNDCTGTFTITDPVSARVVAIHVDFENSPEASTFLIQINKEFVLQQKECKDFFMTQADVNNSIKRVTTTNIPSDDIVWHFENADNGYYYIVRNNTGGSEKEYLCLESGDNNFRLIGLSDFQSSKNKDIFKFAIIQKEKDGGIYYNFQIKGDTKYVQKSNGNNHTAYVNAGTDSNHNRDLWGIKNAPTTLAEMKALINLPVFGSFDDNHTYYKIQNVAKSNYYIAPILDNNGHTYAKGYADSEMYADDPNLTEERTRWYLKVAEETKWNTYYYLINAETGLYMKFVNQGDKAIIVEDKGTNDAYKFLIVKTANEKTNEPKFNYNIIPKNLESEDNQVNNSLQLHSTPVYSLRTSSSRSNNNTSDILTQWIFVPDDSYVTPPVITQNTDEQNEDYLKITITCPEGYSDVYNIYYTTNGTDPVIPELNAEPTASTSSYSAAFLPAIDATTIKAVAVLKTDHSKSSSIVSFELSKCATPTVSSFATGTVTLGTTTTGASIYYTTNETDPVLAGVTPSSSAATPEIACETNSKTTIKAVAAKQGMQPSDVFTQEVIYMPTITFTGGDSYTYTGSEITPTLNSVKVDGDDTEFVDECTINGYSDDRVNVGTVTITITQNTTSSRLIYGTKTFEITKKTVTIIADDASKVYDGTALTKNTATAEGLLVGHSLASVTVTGSQTAVGTSNNVPSAAVIKNGDEDVTMNYDITYNNGTLEVTAKAVTITADDASKVYDGTALTKDSYTNTELAAGDAVESVTMTGSQTVVGTSDNVPSAAVIKNGDEDVTMNYDITYTNGTLEVTKKALTITAGSDTKVYDGEPLTKNSYTNSDLAAGDNIESVTITGSQTVVGSSDNVPSAAVIKNGDGDEVTTCYEITYENGTLTVTGMVLTITAGSDTKVYDGTALTNDSYTSTILGEGDYIESVTVTGSQTIVGTSNNVPSAAVIKNASSENVTANYAITYANGTLEVTQKALTITADGASKVYDGTALTKNSYTNTELAAGDAVESVTMTGSQTLVGSSDNVPSAAVIKNGSGDNVTSSYDITYANGTLEVTPKSIADASITITIDKDENGYIIIVKDGETTLVPKPDIGDEYDYTITVDQSNPNYYKVIVTGRYKAGEDENGNYTGETTVRYALTNFMNDGDQGTEWSCTFVAEEDHALPTGFKAYTVTGIDGNVVNVSAEDDLTFIPANVPILLLSDADHKGFRVAAPASTSDISALTGGNKLKVVNSSTPNYYSDSESEHYKTAHFNVATIYLLYRDEFVLNKDGYLAEGKVYLPVPSGGGNARLRIRRASTGINDIQKDNNTDITDDKWYTLDGRRLSGKPTKKGLYLKEGKKVVIK